MHPFLPSSSSPQKEKLMGSVVQPDLTEAGSKKTKKASTSFIANIWDD